MLPSHPKQLIRAYSPLTGCGSADKPPLRENLPVTRVPASALKTVQAKFPDTRFDHAWTLPNGRIQVRGKNKAGKIHEIEMSPAGEILLAE